MNVSLPAQVYSWERTKIMEEIAILELKQKRLITMLSQIDPVIYLQKLQQELSALQVLKIDNDVKIETVLI